jgi:hypothetical protein
VSSCSPCRRIPWTQTWACLYVASFMIFAALEFLASAKEAKSLADASLDDQVSTLEASDVREISEMAMDLASKVHLGLLVWTQIKGVPAVIHATDLSLIPTWI